MVNRLSIRRHWPSFDFILLLLVCAFAVFGIMMIGAAEYYWDKTAVSPAYASQKLFFITGLAVLAIFTVVDYHFIAKFHWLIYGLMIILLVVVMVVGADDSSGTARWIRFGDSFAIQPSEFCKIFMIVFLAKFIDNRRDSINNIGVFCLLTALAVLPVIFIYVQPALSASMVISAIVVCIFFSSNLKYRYILIPLLIIAPLAILFIWDVHNKPHLFIDKFIKGYQLQRVEDFALSNKTGPGYYQTRASLRSMGSGMFQGKGYKRGSYIPLGANDFIFSVIGEQFGFVGCACTLLAIFLIISKCIIIANRSPDMLGRLIAMGVAGKLAFEAFVNVSVATNILPNTGMPFPFLSSGGSSMWVNLACIGLVLNVGLFKAKSIFKE